MNAPRKDKGARLIEFPNIWVKALIEIKEPNTARDAVRLGAELLMLKEITPHGLWRDEVNKRGMEASTAAKLMACARRFRGAPLAFFDAAGTFSKLYELLPLDGDLCDDLMQGKEVQGLTLQALTTMTGTETREAVRQARGLADQTSALAARAEAPFKQSLLEPLLAPAQKLPWPGQLTVDEERMLRLFRQCDAKTREALFLVAELQARP